MQQNTLTINPQIISIESAPNARSSLTMQQHKAFASGGLPMQFLKNKNQSNNVQDMNLLGYICVVAPISVDNFLFDRVQVACWFAPWNALDENGWKMDGDSKKDGNLNIFVNREGFMFAP